MPQDPFRNGLPVGIGQLVHRDEEENLPEPVEADVEPEGEIRADHLVRELDKRNLSPEQIKELKRYMGISRLGSGYLTVPMTCSHKCPVKSRCPIHQAGIPIPVGDPCPVERAAIVQSREEKLSSLGIDPSDEYMNAFDAHLVDDMVIMDVLKRRAFGEMANDPTIVEKSVAAVINGTEIEKENLNPRITAIEKLTKLQLSMMRELLATRREKTKAEGRMHDPSKQAAELAKRIREVMDKKEQDPIDAEFSVSNQDQDNETS